MAGKKGPRSPRALEAAAARKERNRNLYALFARNLEDARVRKGWNQSEVATEATKHMPKDRWGRPKKKVGRDMISGYTRERTKPSAVTLNAIAKAFNMDPEELLPRQAPLPLQRKEPQFPPFSMREQSDGMVWLRVNRVVTLDVALQVAALMKGAAPAGEG